MYFWKNKHVLKFVTVVTAIGIFWGGMPVSSYAAAFSHKHTSGCYKEVTKTCSAHSWAHGREIVYRYCDSCNATTRCSYDTYKDCCKNNLVGDVLSKWDITCEACGKTIETRDADLGTHQYKVKELKCGMSESSTAATVTVTADITSWTNKDVTVSCNVSCSDSTFSLAGNAYSFNGGAFSGSSSAAVSSNGSYSFTVMDANGRTVSESISVSNIDKEAPSVYLTKSTDAWTEEGLTISACAEDSGSGLAAEAYNFNGSFSSSNSIFVKENGTYSVTVCDKAGNTSSASITVSNIGKDPKVIEEERKKEEEKKKKEEEEKKKKEEEEKRKREEEEKKKKEEKKEDVKPGNDDKPGEDKKPEEEKKDPSDDKKTPEIKKDPTPSDNPAKPKEDEGDVSGNDVSENDVSGNLIPVNDELPPDGGNDGGGMKKTEISTQETAAKTSLWDKIMGISPIFRNVILGGLFLLTAFIIFSSFNLVYYSGNGRIVPVSLARTGKDRKKFFVKISSEGIERDKNYKVFYSLWSRLSKRKRTVEIDVDGRKPSYVSEDGCCFAFNG